MNKAKKTRIDKVLKLMPTGRENAVSMGYIAQMTGTSARDVRLVVNEARLAGHMIIGDDYGYYLPETDEELIVYHFRLRSRVRTSQSILRKVKRTLREKGIDPDDNGGVSDEE